MKELSNKFAWTEDSHPIHVRTYDEFLHTVAEIKKDRENRSKSSKANDSANAEQNGD